MTTKIEFINAVQKALSDFEQLEVNISTRNAKDILHIRGLLDSNETFLELHALITDYVNNKMFRNVFWFLPFVNDLKSHMLNLLDSSKFDPVKWLHETRRNRRCNSTGNLSEVNTSDSSGNDETIHSNCELRFTNLEREIEHIKEHNTFYVTKNEQLEKSVAEISTNYKKIKTELDEVRTLLTAAQTEIASLNLTILQKDKEIERLSTENGELKAKLRQNDNNDQEELNTKKSKIRVF